MTIRSIRSIAVVAGAIALSSGFMASCADHSERCELNGTCPLPAAGRTATAGASSKGGSANGGATAGGGNVSTSGTGNGNAGAATAGTSSTTSCGTCSGATPLCDTAANRCVTCLKNTDCTNRNQPVCEPTTGACVACLTSADCTSATASRCDVATHSCTACAVDADCASVTGKPVCLFNATAGNQCVQCTGKKYTACGSFVCDSATNTCSTTATVQSAGVCQPCVSDAQCKAGEACVEEVFDGKSRGYFCLWREGGGNGAPALCGSTSRPFYDVVTTPSIDGEAGTYCALRVSTCKAYNQFSQTNCAPNGTPTPGLCGYGEGTDATCALARAGSNEYRCTMACLSDDDCKVGVSCLAGASPQFCSLTTTASGGTTSTGTAGAAGRP